MSLMGPTGCCCGALCTELGAMCICEPSEDYAKGCYENITAAQAEEENGLWAGAGTTCGDISGCPDCCDGAGGDFLLPLTRKKCCYPTRIKTECNGWVIDDCARLKNDMLTKCECDSIGGTWDVVGKCDCNDSPECDSYGCCPPAVMPSGTTGTIVVIKSVLTIDKYVYNWGCVDCAYTGCNNISNVYDEHYNEVSHIMESTDYSNYVSHLHDTDYHIVCTTPQQCGAQDCYESGDFLKVTSIAAVYSSTCECSNLNSAILCGHNLTDCYYNRVFTQTGRYTCANCNSKTFNDSYSGVICCDCLP